jgi:hypothetical protein
MQNIARLVMKEKECTQCNSFSVCGKKDLRNLFPCPFTPTIPMKGGDANRYLGHPRVRFQYLWILNVMNPNKGEDCVNMGGKKA